MNSMNTKEENRFNCPIDGCVYGLNGNKYFKRKLFLTQHIANKHSEKKFSCHKCKKKYAIEWQLKYHQKSCGLQWSCGTCDKSYTERLSLVMHCKRHSHSLPKNALIKTSKTAVILPPINVQLLVLPLVFDSHLSQNQSTVIQNKLINILPKIDESIPRSNCETQTFVSEECNKCKIKSNVETISIDLKKCNSISTQTERLNHKLCKSGELRSTECQTNRKRNRKIHSNNKFESIETQTLESALHLSEFSTQNNCLKISASTSTSPPKKNKRKSLLLVNKLDDNYNSNYNCINSVQKSSAFTQTIQQSCTSTATTTDSEVFANNSNPLLAQIYSNNILEQSVQTEAIELCFNNEFNNIETQTVNLDISSDDLLDFSTNEEFLFSEFTDIETQTIWNNDRTTQTDEYLDQINDVFLRYLDNENECHNMSNKTIFADTQTQTQMDFPLICSSAQTSQPFFN